MGEPPGQNEAGGAAVTNAACVEKPDLETAKSYVAANVYCWNSGMFLFRASAVLSALEEFAPDIVAACRQAVERGTADLDFFRLNKTAFSSCPGNSIDYALMEKTDRGAMIPMAAGWNDLGSWEALWQVGEKDGMNNVVKGDVVLHDVEDSYLHAEDRLLAAVGLKDHIVVETSDAVMISPRDRVQDVKGRVDRLKDQQREETRSHKRSYRPWGTVDSLVTGARFQVNRITVNPGGALSLQKHFNRSEHWIVVRGSALVTRADEQFVLKEDSSTYISAGIAHRLENPGKIPLELIEVQTGGYIGDDDITRLEDIYGRHRENGGSE
jgi:mannose-1-phosphate guanylyltransferase/mannose-6-phosphate isomerase